MVYGVYGYIRLRYLQSVLSSHGSYEVITRTETKNPQQKKEENRNQMKPVSVIEKENKPIVKRKRNENELQISLPGIEKMKRSGNRTRARR